MNMNEFFIWEGIYSTFEEASIQKNLDIFNEELWINNINRDIKDCIKSIQSNTSIPIFYKQRSILLPILVSTMIEKKDFLNILDFGGGLGIGYLTTNESLINNFEKINYIIIELNQLVEDGKKIYFLDNSNKNLFGNNISFSNSLPENIEIDIFHTASAIQYIQDWKALIIKATNLKPQYLLFSDVFAGDIPTFVTLQNYYNNKVQHWFFNFKEFVSFTESLGYKLILKQTVSSLRANNVNILPMNNFPDSHRLKETLQLLFIKL